MTRRNVAGRLADGTVRVALRLAYRLLRVWWRWRRPRHEGAVVALWSHGRVLLVAHSYRPGWGMPGGGMARGEPSEATALRELREELGLVLSPRQLSLACVLEDDWMGRHETVHIFEAMLDEEPALAIDNREIVAAEFVAAEAAARRDLPPHARRYLARRASTAPT